MRSAEHRVGDSDTQGEHRLRKGELTRQRILDTARAVFADVGYERATIRGIAAAADVDKSSVTQYFGTKQNLFREAVSWRVPVAEVAAKDPTRVAENLARGMFARWGATPNSPTAVLLRASMTSDEAAALLRDHISNEVVPGISEAIKGPQARLRAALFGAMLMGIASQRYLLDMPDIANADEEEIMSIIAPLMEQLFDPPSR